MIFIGSEPHLDAERYAKTFLEIARELKVKRVAAIGGVYGEMPYDQDRSVSCVYSLPEMKEELQDYAVQFSNYEGGVSIGTYMAHWAEPAGIELAVFYALVPAYDFSERAEKVELSWKSFGRGFIFMWDYKPLIKKETP